MRNKKSSIVKHRGERPRDGKNVSEWEKTIQKTERWRKKCDRENKEGVMTVLMLWNAAPSRQQQQHE